MNLAWAKPKKKKLPTPAAQPKALPVHNLFVANLPFQARAKDLKEFFNGENANVVSAEVIFHDNPRGSAGYGFVSFNTKNEADAALTSFNGKVIVVVMTIRCNMFNLDTFLDVSYTWECLCNDFLVLLLRIEFGRKSCV